MTDAPNAANETEYGGVPPLMVSPHGAQVERDEVTFETTEKEGDEVDVGVQDDELPSAVPSETNGVSEFGDTHPQQYT